MQYIVLFLFRLLRHLSILPILFLFQFFIFLYYNIFIPFFYACCISDMGNMGWSDLFFLSIGEINAFIILTKAYEKVKASN